MTPDDTGFLYTLRIPRARVYATYKGIQCHALSSSVIKDKFNVEESCRNPASFDVIWGRLLTKVAEIQCHPASSGGDRHA
jgi:hypothetical protein